MDGTPFGRYRLVELLGRGGMGEVWRAYDSLTNRDVAIKLLPPHLAQDNTFVQRFRREAEAAARVNSPHIIPIHDYGEIDGRLFVNMRLVEGQDLQELLADGPLHPARAVRIIEQVAKALQAAHKIGLVHRDVKPSNVLLDEDDFAYLIDFGIARGADETRLTGTGAMVGSWHYMSPERLQAGQVDARADIYALACVLYECLTGSTPFPGDSVEQQITAHLTAPPPRPSRTDPNVPATFDPVIATGMAKDPDQRYATTVELANAAHGAITTPIPRQAPRGEPTLLGDAPPAAPTLLDPGSTTPAPALNPVGQQPADPNLAAPQQRPPGWPPVPQPRPLDRTPPQIGTPPQPLWAPPQQPPQPAPARRSATPWIIAGVAAAIVVVLVAYLITRAYTNETASQTAVSTSQTAGSAAQTAASTSQTAPSTSQTAPSASQTTTSAATPGRPNGDLGLGTPMSQPACDGTGIVVLGNATNPGSYAADVQRFLNQYPGASYLRTDEACPSLRQSLNGNPIYAVYRVAGRTEADVCAAVRAAGGDAYGKWLDTSSDPNSYIRQSCFS